VRGIAGLDLIPKFDTRTKEHEIRFCFAYSTTLYFCLRVDPGTRACTGSTASASAGAAPNTCTDYHTGTIAAGSWFD
jgi:hypothetical protein